MSFSLDSDVEYTFSAQLTRKPGLYKYKAVVSTGPIVIQTKMHADDAFTTVVDGSIAATEDKVISIADGETLKVTIPVGDFFYMGLVEKGLN